LGGFKERNSGKEACPSKIAKAERPRGEFAYQGRGTECKSKVSHKVSAHKRRAGGILHVHKVAKAAARRSFKRTERSAMGVRERRRHFTWGDEKKRGPNRQKKRRNRQDLATKTRKKSLHESDTPKTEGTGKGLLLEFSKHKGA